MLNYWMSHDDYLAFLDEGIQSLSPSDQERLFGSFSSSLEKLTLLSLDPVLSILFPFYSPVGRPAKNQPQILRSLLLMVDLGELSLKNWIRKLAFDPVLALLIGSSIDSLPPLGCYYDFIDRLTIRDKLLLKQRRKKLFKVNFFKKPKRLKLKKGEKLPPRHPNIVRRLVNYLKQRPAIKSREQLLQDIFFKAAVLPSFNEGIISGDDMTLAGDGTCLPVSSSHWGTKVCSCRQKGIWGCQCERLYSDPDARWGWDSSKEQWFYGHSIYLFSYYNQQLKTDLPVYFRFFDANRHDSISAVVSLAEFRERYSDLKIHSIVLDSAHDNYPTYELCSEWGIIPFIDLNPANNGNLTYSGHVTVNEKGQPVCMGGHHMVNWGLCNDRNRRKWRCPLACGKIEECTSKEECSPSEYGRVIYTKPSDDPRIFTPVPRGTKAFRDAYKTRTCSERVNDRILNDYKVEHIRIRGRRRYAFFTMAACILIHLDARLKNQLKHTA